MFGVGDFMEDGKWGKDKLLSLSGVNAPELFGNLFWRVGSVAHRSLITVRIVV